MSAGAGRAPAVHGVAPAGRTAAPGIADGPRRAVLATIEAYRRWISPLLPRSCRYLPSCSEYGATAIEMHGLARGSLLALRRLLRCHPFANGGYDPVR